MSGRKRGLAAALLLALCLAGCAAADEAAPAEEAERPAEGQAEPEEKAEEEEKAEPEEKAEEEETLMLQMKIGETPVAVTWEENASVEALRELCREEPLTIDLSMYGGFEQVGPIGTSLPRKDAQTTTEAGDIVLYAGNQIVVFYGSNSWAYTRLGHISDRSAEELAELLGRGDVTITLWLEGER
jgi:hypothetical protein